MAIAPTTMGARVGWRPVAVVFVSIAPKRKYPKSSQ